MMKHRKRWLAASLAIAIALGDCGGMSAYAVEDAGTQDTISENNVIPDDDTLSDPASEKTTSLSEANTTEADEIDNADEAEALPSLHIGQIPEGEELPAADDDSFPYDLPVSFETSENLILFVNYDIDVPEANETGTLEWSILRGEKGQDAGSTNLLEEEDDWNGFETVSASPCFAMEEITDEGSDYRQMMSLTLGESATDEADGSYDYYIRAAYYPEDKTDGHGSFYSAVTVPFLPLEDPSSDTEETPEGAADREEISAGDVAEETSVSENTTEETSVSENTTEESSVSENSAGLAADETQDVLTEELPETEDGALSADENGAEDADAGANAGEEAAATVSGNALATADGLPAANSEQTTLEAETAGKLDLYQGTEIITDNIAMSYGDTLQITAKAEPAMAQADLAWESSDETVATVQKGENGTATITASAEGYAKITASCQGLTASAVIDVVPDKANPDFDKLLDLSGDIRVAGFEKESLTYNGQKITQNLRVYHKNTLLKEKTDYTLSYKNNINAAAWNTVKAPSVTINLKGQYQGSVTLYYTINPLDINNIDIYNTVLDENGDPVKQSPGYEQALNYSKNLKIPAPALTFGKKKLAVNRDFTCDYSTLPKDYKKGDSYEAGHQYTYTVNGAGNFTGSFPMQLVVLKDKTRNFSSASVKLDKKQYEYHGAPLAKSDVHITEVKISGTVLNAADFDYEVFATGTEGAYVMVSPSASGKAAGYCGCKKVTLKLVGDRLIKDAAAGTDWKETIPFSQKTVDKNGGIFQTGAALLAYDKLPLTEGTDYTVKYSNAKKAGRVTATFTGKGRYKGSCKLTYTITPNTDIRVFMGKNVKNNNGTYEVAYQKGGAVPELILKDQDYSVLKIKTDYTIKYKDNKTPGTPMTCEIKGKGSYAGYEKTVTLMVTKADISQCTISIPDKPYSDKPNKWKSTVTIKDTNGKKLTAGKDYDKAFVYSHTQEQSPRPDTEITVTVKGLDCYEGSTITGTYRIFEKNISSLKVVIDPQEYTGEAITLTPVKDIHLYANGTDAKNKQNEITKACYKIIDSEYKNNIKAGTAKVTLQGTGEYGGTKTYSFKIQKKKYLINRVKGITLDKNSLSFPLAEQDEEKRTLTATVTSESDEKIANPTVVWTSSNSSIVSVEEKSGSAVSGSADGKKTVSVSAVLTLKKEGSVTITATTQDGNKKVQCKVTVIDAPVLLEAGQTIKENVGSTYQLHMKFAETQDTSKLKWESNNPNAVSIDQSGLLTMKKAGAAIIKAVYTSNNKSFTQQCYAVAIGENEAPPEPETGALLTYNQRDGITDDTPYINKMLRDYEWGDSTHVREVTLYLPAGVYHIDATAGGNDSLGNYKFGGIVLTTNQKLVMSPSALLVALPNNKGNSQVINITGRDGVSVSGGQIIGERKEHKGSSGEWGHGIAVFGGTNVTIENIDISQCWGDGIYLGFYDGPNTYSSGVTIKNCTVHDNRRNNLSITDVSNVTVTGCQFTNAHGVDPQYGIDIEPNRNRTCSNVTISNSTFRGNAGGTIQILGQLNAHVKGVKITNCTGDKAPVVWSGFGGSVSGVEQSGNHW